MKNHKSKPWIALAGLALAMAPLSAMAAPVITGLVMDAPLSIGLWPLGGLGSLVVLSLARVTSWRRQVSRLQEELDEQIVERHRAEHALAEKEAFFRNVMDTNPNPIFIKDRDARFTFVNQAAAELFGGKSPGDIVGRLEVEVLHHDSKAQRYRKEDLVVMDTLREKFLPDEALMDSQGRTRWFQTVKRPLVSEDGMARQVLGVATDISERKQSEAELVAEQELLRVLMEHSPDLIYFKDSQSRFIRCSRALCELFGAAHEDIVGKTDFDFFSPAHAQYAFDDEREIMRTGQPLTGKVERNTMKDGTDAWSLTAKMPLRDKSNQIIGTCGISKNITAIKEAEARLELVHGQLLETSRLAGMAEVATSVLHNVGNVLNSVNVSTSLVSQTIRSSRVGNLAKAMALIQEHRENLGGFFTNDIKGRQLPGYLSDLAVHLAEEQQAVLKELAALNSNVEHIKEIVAMQQSYAKITGMVETLNIEALAEDALRMNSGAMLRHQVEVHREYDQVPTVASDKHKILQILVNLIRNAKYALDEGQSGEKRLTLRITATGKSHVNISVIDNGVGIPPENLGRIFGHGFTTRKDGHGFGLHSGALAARELGGTLTVHSDGPGKGATFTLELPCQREPDSK